MIRLVKVTARGSTILGEALYQADSSQPVQSMNPKTVVRIRLGNQYVGGSTHPIDLRVDQDGAELLIRMLAVQLMKFKPEEEQLENAAAFLHNIALALQPEK